MGIKKMWRKFFLRKEPQTWKTDVYFGVDGNENLRGHLVASGAIISEGKLIGGEVYYLRDIYGKVLINRDEKGRSLL